MTRTRLALTVLAASVAAATLTAPAALADDPTAGVSRTELQRSAAPTPGFEIIQTRFEIPVGKESGRHSHPGPEVGYIVQGDVDMVFDDRPTQHLHSGDPFLIPAGVVHNARNVGTVRTLMLSTYVVPVDQPLVTKY
ncbi:cupin domain-containing protein [Mycolicibacterium sp. 050232]|uniref:cupin domain-containing protein n=1 Tax=Mycolicibacterium sp. 050232 TaxID=3113982 RepID=UPI002E2A427D|nr:cupin domain-containing protein [Mycolicibacterium sp. 050232]MED5816384.1 cupin domain-containing protein [Mycolicibacterium sp. 050232]